MYFAAARYRMRLLRLLAAGGPYTAALCVVFLAQAIVPAVAALATGTLVQQATQSTSTHLPARVLAPLVVLGCVLILGQVVEQLGSPLRFAVARRVDEAHRAGICAAA